MAAASAAGVGGGWCSVFVHRNCRLQPIKGAPPSPWIHHSSMATFSASESLSVLQRKWWRRWSQAVVQTFSRRPDKMKTPSVSPLLGESNIHSLQHTHTKRRTHFWRLTCTLCASCLTGFCTFNGLLHPPFTRIYSFIHLLVFINFALWNCIIKGSQVYITTTSASVCKILHFCDATKT